MCHSVGLILCFCSLNGHHTSQKDTDVQGKPYPPGTGLLSAVKYMCRIQNKLNRRRQSRFSFTFLLPFLAATVTNPWPIQGDKMLKISCSFSENLSKLYVGVPPSPPPRRRVGAVSNVNPQSAAADYCKQLDPDFQKDHIVSSHM